MKNKEKFAKEIVELSIRNKAFAFNGTGQIFTSTIKYSLYTKQVIIGAETGNRKNKVIPQKEWIYNIVKACDDSRVKVFMKESLRSIMGEDFRQDRLPWEV